MSDKILCPPCGIDLHNQCWWFDGDETAEGPCMCVCHAEHVAFVDTVCESFQKRFSEHVGELPPGISSAAVRQAAEDAADRAAKKI